MVPSSKSIRYSSRWSILTDELTARNLGAKSYHLGQNIRRILPSLTPVREAFPYRTENTSTAFLAFCAQNSSAKTYPHCCSLKRKLYFATARCFNDRSGRDKTLTRCTSQVRADPRRDRITLNPEITVW